MQIGNHFKLWLFFIGILVIVSLACSSADIFQTPPVPGSGQVETAAQPSVTPRLSTPTPAPIGFSRKNPFPKTEIVSGLFWDVQVLEIKRGADAWKDIQAANQFNKAAPNGMEYLLVKLRVKNKHDDNDEHPVNGCDFRVTGDRLIVYTCAMSSVVAPKPQLRATLFAGGEIEGWISFAVWQGEGNLMLMVEDGTFTLAQDNVRFVALDDKASITLSPELSGIEPNDLGKTRSNPASRAETVITDDWQISILDVVRGESAWSMAQQANKFNDPPDEGMEYIAVKVHVRYSGAADQLQNISGSFFKTTGSAGVLYDLPSVVDPYPSLDISLYPGGEYDGWVMLQVAINETNIRLVFEPHYDSSGESKRFISLEP